MNAVDKAALALKFGMEDGAIRGHLQQMLADDGWEQAAKRAAFLVQFRTMNLRPWQNAPCHADQDDDDAAGKLLRRMIRNGISRWHPDPVAELDRRRVGRCRS